MSARIYSWLTLSAASAITLAYAAAPMGDWQSLPGALYFIHGGSLADQQIPTAKDSKLSILIDGHPAKEVFDSIGPDLAGSCSDANGDRARVKKGIYCSYTALDKGTKDGPYRCWIGLDLRTGDSVVTVSC